MFRSLRHHTEGHPHPEVPVGGQNGVVPEVGQTRPAVVEVDEPGLASPHIVHDVGQHRVVEVFLGDRGPHAMQVDVGPLEDVLGHAPAQGRTRVVMTVDESRKYGMAGRSDPPVEGTETLQIAPLSDPCDGPILDHERAVPDIPRGGITEDDEGISHHQRPAHRGPPTLVLLG